MVPQGQERAPQVLWLLFSLVAGGKMKQRTETRTHTVCPWLQLATATTRAV